MFWKVFFKRKKKPSLFKTENNALRILHIMLPRLIHIIKMNYKRIRNKKFRLYRNFLIYVLISSHYEYIHWYLLTYNMYQWYILTAQRYFIPNEFVMNLTFWSLCTAADMITVCYVTVTLRLTVFSIRRIRTLGVTVLPPKPSVTNYKYTISE